jgi:hypothetical protein
MGDLSVQIASQRSANVNLLCQIDVRGTLMFIGQVPGYSAHSLILAWAQKL